jgi:hypothetical protein
VTKVPFLILVAIVPALAGATIAGSRAVVAQTASCALGPETELTGTWSGDDVAGVFTLAQKGDRVTGTLDVQGTVYRVSGSCASPMHLVLKIPRPMDESYSGCQGFDSLKDRPWVLTLAESADGQQLSGQLEQGVVDSNGLSCIASWKTRNVILKRHQTDQQ